MSERPSNWNGLVGACLYDIADAMLHPEPVRTDLSMVPPGRADSGLQMTNFDYTIDDGLEEALRAGRLGKHAEKWGWD